MAAIAKFLSFDGGIAFSDSVLKIQKRDEERGRLIPIENIAGIDVEEPLLGDDGCIRVQIAEKKPSARNAIYFDEEQYNDALDFKAAFDSFVGQSAQALPPLEMFQPTAIANRPKRERRYTEPERPQRPARRRKRRFKWWYAAIAIVFVAILVTPSKKDDDSEPQQESAVYATTEPTAAEAEIESGRYTLPCGMTLNFSPSVRNDVTGRWRISTTSDSIVPADYALEYYNALFSSDDEIHAIWNATLNTTTRITASDGLLYVDTLEYVDGEEHDANLLFSGTVLDSKIINIETGQEVSYGDGEETTAVVGFTSPPAATSPPVTEAPVQEEATYHGHKASTTVYVSNNGKIHLKSNCSGMKNYTTMTLGEAENRGYDECSKCF